MSFDRALVFFALILLLMPLPAMGQSDASFADAGGSDAAMLSDAVAVDAPSANVDAGMAATARRRVYAGVYLHDLIRFDQKAGTFDAEFELWVKWAGEFDPDRLRVANAASIERVSIARESEGTWHAARYRVRGTMRGEFPVHRFPFDAQSPTIELELDARDGTLVTDITASGMRDRFSVSGWSYSPNFQGSLTTIRYASDLGSLAGEGEGSITQRAVFRLTLRRPLVTAALKFFLPLLIILLVALVALFLAPDLIDARASIGVTALLACFAFQFAVSDSMPDVSYMTLADAIFLLSYFSTSLALFITVIAYGFDRAKRTQLARRIDLVARVALPLIVVIPSIRLVQEQPRPPVRHVAPVPSRPRPQSARPLLRIGATQLSSAMGTVVSYGAYWGPTHFEREEGPQPWLVEAVPELDDDALHIDSDGTLAVRWRLRDAHWSDGSPLTTRDVAFAQRAAPSQDIGSIDVLSEREFVIHYRARTASALESFSVLPERTLSAAFARGGYEALRTLRRAGQQSSIGPYRIESFDANRSLVLVRNEHFVGATPSIARIEIRRYEDGAALVAAFERAEIDLTVPNAIAPELVSAFAERRPESVNVRPSRVMVFLHPDLTVPALRSQDVRQAIALLIDRDALVRETYGDTGRPAHAPWIGAVPSGSSAFVRDVVEARRLLDRAGATGAQLALRHSADPVDRRTANRLAEMLREGGLQIELIELREVGELYRTRRHGGLLLYSGDVDSTEHPLRWWNVPMQGSRYDRTARNAAFDDGVAALVERYTRTIYRERREALRERLAAMVHERLPTIPVMFTNQRVLAAPKLRDWDQGEATDFGEGVERWHFSE